MELEGQLATFFPAVFSETCSLAYTPMTGKLWVMWRGPAGPGSPGEEAPQRFGKCLRGLVGDPIGGPTGGVIVHAATCVDPLSLWACYALFRRSQDLSDRPGIP